MFSKDYGLFDKSFIKATAFEYHTNDLNLEKV